MRFKVPQNIDIEDRILGPLSMVQFVYAVIGFGFSYVVYSAIPTPFSYIIIAPVLLFVVLLDFVKINERPFLDFFKSAIVYMSMPRQRFWHQGDDTDMDIEFYQVKKDTGPVVQSKGITTEDISALARSLDTKDSRVIKR